MSKGLLLMPHRLPQILHLDLEFAFAGDQFLALIMVLTLKKKTETRSGRRSTFSLLQFSKWHQFRLENE